MALDLRQLVYSLEACKSAKNSTIKQTFAYLNKILKSLRNNWNSSIIALCVWFLVILHEHSNLFFMIYYYNLNKFINILIMNLLIPMLPRLWGINFHHSFKLKRKIYIILLCSHMRTLGLGGSTYQFCTYQYWVILFTSNSW